MSTPDYQHGHAADPHGSYVQADMCECGLPVAVGHRCPLTLQEAAALAQESADRIRAQRAAAVAEEVELMRWVLDSRADSCSRLQIAAEWLLRLKDGPRDAAYELEKPYAWDALRRALSRCTQCAAGYDGMCFEYDEQADTCCCDTGAGRG